MQASARWNRLEPRRTAVLERARTCAKLTIPSLLLPSGHSDTSPLPTPYQSLGARGANNVASKLLLSLLPAGRAFFRLHVSPKLRAELQASGALEAATQALAVIEQSVSRKIETLNFRPVLFEVLKHLVVTGNAVLFIGNGVLRMFRLDQFVIARSPEGKPIELVIKERVHPDALDETVKAACKIPADAKEELDLFTCVKWKSGREYEWQELNGEKVPDSEGDRPEEKGYWLPLRWQAVPGFPYGRGLCEEYLGDLMSLEGLSESVVKFAAAAAKIVFMVRPASSTKWKDIVKARSGEAIPGVKEDVSVLQVEKYADFQVAKSLIDDLTLRLSHAFLLRSGTVRDAERVTAEEIRQMAQELEDVLGGVYTVLAQELQLPLVRRLMASMQASRELPALPSDTVDPVIVTGFEALGRNHGVNVLRAWIADLAQIDPQLSVVKKDAVATRLGVGYGVEDLNELVKSPEEMAAERQAAMQQQITMDAAPGVAQVAAKAAAEQ